MHCCPFLPSLKQHCSNILSCFCVMHPNVMLCSVMQCSGSFLYNSQCNTLLQQQFKRQCSVVYWSDVLTAINANQDDRSGRPGLEVTEIIWQKCDAQNEDDSSNSTEYFSTHIRTPQTRASECYLCQFLHLKYSKTKFGLKQQYCY